MDQLLGIRENDKYRRLLDEREVYTREKQEMADLTQTSMIDRARASYGSDRTILEKLSYILYARGRKKFIWCGTHRFLNIR